MGSLRRLITPAGGLARSLYTAPARAPLDLPSNKLIVNPAKSVHFVPMVVEQTGSGERAFDLFSRLLSERIICVMAPIDDHIASLVIGQLLHLQGANSTEPISMYINSPGGLVSAGLAIYDTMQYVTAPISTWCIGRAMSAASLILCAGAPGMRYSLPHSRIMVHQPSGGAQGQATDIAIQAAEILYLRNQLNNIYVKHCGKTLEEIEKVMERDTYMSSEEAKVFGLIDHVTVQPPPPSTEQTD